MNDETNKILRRVETLLRGLLRASLSAKLAQIEADKTLRKILAMTGKDIPVSRIAKSVGVSTGKISGIWKSWEECGLIAKDGKSYQKLA